MRNTVLFILAFFAINFALSSCDNQKTAMELIKEEKKAIDRFIHKKGFKILKTYPENGVFQENEYFKTSEGLYIHVIDSGNGKHPVYMRDEILFRYEGGLYFKTNADTDTFNSDADPYSFIYGNAYSYGNYGCDGFAVPLNYVGENGVVSLIVPSGLGNVNDKQSYRPVYYAKLKYTGFY